MIIVIIAGGSGTRLWPLSTPEYPKHLLKVDGDNYSLLQRTYNRAKLITDKIYVVSEEGHITHVKEQLSDLAEDHFVIEPARRGTASCIIAALAHIAPRQDHDEPIVAIHSDHYIRDTQGFVECFKVVEEVCKSEKRIVLVGVEPTYPAIYFGYIQKGERLSESPLVYNVHSFKEKPDFDVAKDYVNSGDYLWNCGYFAGSINTFVDSMQQHAPELHSNYQKLLNTSPTDYRSIYMAFPSIAIDYALIEKVPDLLVVPASFDWMDLGSFNDLHSAIGGDEHGNYLHGKVEIEEVENSLVQNHEAKPLAVIGLDNVVVINTPEGILVARKDLSQKVGDISKRFQKK